MRFTLCFFLSLLLGSHLLAQTSLSGVINNYSRVVAIDSLRNAVVVNPSTGFAAGDKVLLIQMQGAILDQNNTAGFGDVDDYNGAGSYQVTSICRINGDTLVLDKVLHPYDVNGNVQCIKIPLYQNAQIDNVLSCQAWNGSSGGVLVLEVEGSLTLNAPIDVSGKGFRGGLTEISTYACNFLSTNDDYFYDNTSHLAGMKGEGIAASTNSNAKGRGKMGNGGGGANDHNSGGGGGSNISAGGNGGENRDQGTFTCKGFFPGRGGLALSQTPYRLFMGGGGGAGHANNVNSASGGKGGGIVIIIADTIISNNNYILTNGITATDNTGDGTGAGGAGGTVVLQYQYLADTLKVSAVGGNGGNSVQAPINRCFGPGGGGSGGQVYQNPASADPLLKTNLAGGEAGLVVNSTSSCNGSTNGATAGANGQRLTDYFLFEGIPYPHIFLPKDTSFCNTPSFSMGVSPHFNQFLWSTGTTSASIAAMSTGTYWLKVTEGLCSSADTVELIFFNNSIIDLGLDTTICNGNPLTLDAGSSTEGFLWSSGDTTQSIEVTQAGTYWVQSGTGCVFGDTIVIGAKTVTVNLGNDTSFCSPGSLWIGETNNGTDYLWNTGSDSAFIEVKASGDYWLEVTESGCSDRDTVTITAIPYPQVDLGSDTTICNGSSLELFAANPGMDYLWSTGDTLQVLDVDQSGTYWVVVGDQCRNSDTLTVDIIMLEADLGSDTSFCLPFNEVIGDTVPGATHQWSTGATTGFISINQGGLYWLSVNEGGCTFTDSINIGEQAGPEVKLGVDTTLCAGGEVVLDAGNVGAEYLWSSGDTLREVQATVSGVYWVRANKSGCEGIDSISITFLPVPEVSLGSDTVMCEGDSLSLFAGNAGKELLWNTGDTGNVITITDTGYYSVDVKDSLCTASDEIFIDLCEDPDIHIPNAFSPNGDLLNDSFVIYFPDHFTGKMTIYDRWGERIYETQALNGSLMWDGNYKEAPLPDGIYYYMVHMVGKSKVLFQGPLRLLR